MLQCRLRSTPLSTAPAPRACRVRGSRRCSYLPCFGASTAWLSARQDVAAAASSSDERYGQTRPQSESAQDRQAAHRSATDAAVRLFTAINLRDWPSLLALLADDCLLQDLSCQDAAVGRLAVVQFYRHALNMASPAAQLVIEDITQGDLLRAGLTWHVEMDGLELPSSKGVSFIRTDAQGRIAYVRENPEHFVKLGGLALPALGLAAPVIRTLGPAALPNYWAGGAPGQQAGSDPLWQLVAGATSHFAGSLPLPPAPPFLLPEPAAAADTAAEPLAGRPMYVPGGSAAAASKDNRGAAGTHPSSPGATRNTASSGNRSSSPGIGMRHLPSRSSMSATTQQDNSGSWLGSWLSAFGLGGTSTNSSTSTSTYKVASQFTTSNGSTHKEPGSPAAFESGTSTSSSSSSSSSRAPELSGVWQKDLQRSDQASYERALDLWHLTPLHKAGARLIEGLRIVHSGSSLTIYFLTILPENLFKVTEVFPYGQPGSMGRRDMRPGRCSCSAEQAPDGAVVQARWGEPHAGHLREHYRLVQGTGGVQELHVISEITVGQRSESTLQVFTRSELSSEQLVRASAARHGNYMDLLRRYL